MNRILEINNNFANMFMIFDSQINFGKISMNPPQYKILKILIPKMLYPDICV